MSLRDYQQESKNQIKARFRAGVKKLLLKLPTGGGKTVIFSDLLTETAAKGNRAIMAVRGRKLVDQASERLHREGVHHGVHMAKHWNYRPAAPIQICSIDTLIARREFPPAKLVVIDEAHLAVSPSFIDFLAHYPDAYILGVTATPYTDKTLRHVADEIISPITMKELIARGYLVGFRFFAPSNPDMTNVQISSSTHDYVQSQAADAMQSGNLTGDIIKHWIDLGQDRPTICFAVTVEHSKNIVDKFIRAGISAEHCDADTPEEERVGIYYRLHSGKTKVVSNVGILCTGVDIPPVSCVILARPTKSYSLFVQQCGRGTRPFYDASKYADGWLDLPEHRLLAIADSNKPDCIILDHAGNSNKMGFPTDEPEANLDGKKIKLLKSPKTCQICYAVFYGFRCPKGCILPEDMLGGGREVIQVDGTLEEVKEVSFETQVTLEIERLKKKQKLYGYKAGWVYFKLVDKYGQEVADKFIPKRKPPFWARPSHTDGERSPSSDLSQAEYESLEIPNRGSRN